MIRTCPDCGCTLDPCEVCDCQTKKEDVPAGTGTPSGGNDCSVSTLSISSPYLDVNNLVRIKDLREDAGAMAKDIALVIREKFPKFNRQLLSQCEQYEKYGVILHPDGLKAFCEAYGIKLQLQPAEEDPEPGPEPPVKKQVHRKLERKLTVRVTTGDYERLEKRLQDDGYDTLQAWLYAIIKNYLGGDSSGNS